MGEHMDMRFVLIARGTCTFEEKVRNAQDGGFDAAIIYDNRDKRNLISMVGNSGGIHVHAVFISKAAGEALLKFSQSEDGRCCMSPSAEKIAWAVVVFSLLSVLVIAVVLVTCFIARNRHLRVRSTQHNNLKRKSQLVKALPTLTYGAPFDGKCASEMCAVCLEDYKAGETLRVLPCHHDFHAVCVDSWLTSWKAFCPVCKRDANIEAGCHQVCEHTPLLSCSSRPALPS
ncbi:hypothetical protein AMTR_s00018p00203080 [Amborella trichopoda]|uniref:RING-type domain-containing protein n=2 Tax=Amborella trichopoda TaxID=13333 RepID=W1PE64_AMBTC|nr:hypothetical protein AMTR_s00018p00203080 [Amborella trichopoda]